MIQKIKKMIILAGLFATPAYADVDCNALLHNAIFDFSSNVSSPEGLTGFRNWYCGRGFADEKVAAGLSAGVNSEGAAQYPFAVENMSFRQAYQAFCGDSKDVERGQVSAFVTGMKAAVKKDFDACLASGGVQFGLVEKSSSALTVMAVSNAAGAKPPVVSKVVTSSGLSCSVNQLQNQPIGPSGRSMECKRTASAGSIKLTTNQGTNTELKVHPASSPFKVETGTYDFEFCGSPDCAPANKLVAFGTEENAPTPEGWCANLDVSAGKKRPNSFILARQEMNVSLVRAKKGAFKDLHFRLLAPRSENTVLLCGVRDGLAADWDKYEFSLRLTFQYGHMDTGAAPSSRPQPVRSR